MNLTSKSRYAIKIMMDLAYHQDQALVHRRDIAARHGISTEYLDQIMILLRRASLVKSVRGRSGGYTLGKPAPQISIWELFTAVEHSLEPVQCLSTDQSCSYDISCSSQHAWRAIFNAMKHPLEQLTLDQITSDLIERHQLCPAAGIRECRGPRTSESEVAVSVGSH